MRHSDLFQITLQINEKRMTVDQGTEALIAIFNKNTFVEFGESSGENIEENITDNVATALIRALQSPESKVEKLSFPFRSGRISQQIQLVINESKIPGLMSNQTGLSDEGGADLVRLIENNSHLRSLLIAGGEMQGASWLAIMQAVSKTKISHLSFEQKKISFEGDLLKYLSESNVTSLETYAKSIYSAEFINFLPRSKITRLLTQPKFLRVPGCREACQNLTALSIWGEDDVNTDLALAYLLPSSRITHLEVESGAGFDHVLAENLAKSRVIKFYPYFGLPLSIAAVKENRVKVGRIVSFLVFQSLVPKNVEINFFNGLPKGLFFKILAEAMQPIILTAAYIKRVQAKVEELMVKHNFSDKNLDSIADSSLREFGDTNWQSLIQGLERTIADMIQVQTGFIRENQKLLANVKMHQQLNNLFIERLPLEVLEQFQLPKQSTTLSLAPNTEESAEPGTKKIKSEESSSQFWQGL